MFISTTMNQQTLFVYKSAKYKHITLLK